VNLKRWAEQRGVSYATARRWFGAGPLPVPARRVGRLILVSDRQNAQPVSGVTAVYARVWSADQEPVLGRQVARVAAGAAGDRLAVGRVVTGAGPALNGHRRKFPAVLRGPGVSVIVAGHRGRFAGFGAGCVGAALSARGRGLLVAGPSGADGGLVRGVTGILASLCARLYRRRAAADRATEAVSAVTGGTR
jgi:predicted site-specific integrase-resolvase